MKKIHCRTDAIRPFISSHVANSMAAEVIALLYSLLSAPETQAADTWTIAVEQVAVVSNVWQFLDRIFQVFQILTFENGCSIDNFSFQVITKTLSFLPELLNSLDDVVSLQSNRTQLMFSAKQINATLAALGGFDEMIRPGCEVQVSLSDETKLVKLLFF